MHLEFNLKGRAKPNCFACIDDFGTKHEGLDTYLRSADDHSQKQRFIFLLSEYHDPDFYRARHCEPWLYSARESTSFASPIGLSIEAEIRIDFELHPAWDENHFEPLWTRAEGAQLRITHAGVNEWDWNPASTSITQMALEAFCWAYVEMEQAREDASRRGIVEAEQ